MLNLWLYGIQQGEAMIGSKLITSFRELYCGRIEDFELSHQCKGRQRQLMLPLGWFRVTCSAQIKEEGIAILTDAGFVRQPGCSACLAMTTTGSCGKYSVSTSTGISEGRQGPGSRTLLASPFMLLRR
jgi:3-isopropylmalate/(R)-2-methylmalate dehydratase large subunit